MAELFCILLFRILLPILISTCIVFRPSGLSAIYLLILFCLPFVPIPTEKTMSGCTGVFLKCLIILASLTTIGQIAFQIVLFAMPPYAEILTDNALLEKILRHVGFVRLNNIDPISATVWLSPEVVMFAISIGFFIAMKKLTNPVQLESSNEEGESSAIGQTKTSENNGASYLVALGKYCVLIALCSAAVLKPSIIGGLYFVIFLASATWWSCCKDLRKGFAILLGCLIPVVFIHLNALYLYQFQWPQEFLEKNSTYARYLGLTQLITISANDTDDPRKFLFTNEEWASFANPIVIYLLYYIMVLETKGLLTPESQKKQGPFSRLEGSFSGQLGRQMSQRLSRRQLMRSATTKKRWRSATRKVRESVKSPLQTQIGESTPLIQGVSPSKRYNSGRKGGIFHDSTGSVTVTGEIIEEIPLDELGTLEDEYKPSVIENIVYAVESIVQLLIRSSYIGTNIVMMAWSITYLSWITFVLLIWANLIWLIPNQRKSMLYSSPLLLCYAFFLLISAYIYSMDLTEDELPTKINGINLEEIGFVKIKTLPCVPLFIKCLYTVMFWVTLKQFMQERLENRQSNALADMAAPLQVTVGAAAGVSSDQEKGSKIIEKIGQLIKNFLTKFWIWIVAITLFAVAITGPRMTGFRILYMALFLFFILSFQFSFQIWRKMMFVFWLVVIIYSMIILVMVYTYQFEDFKKYWENLGVPVEQQYDIGLEKFETKQLFVRLVTPTFFVIITVIQLHYFHKDFMQLSDPKNSSILRDQNYDEELDQSSLQGGAVIENSERDVTTTSSVKFNLYELGDMSNAQFQHLVEKWLNKLHHFKNLIYLFLELHMIKVVLFFAMLICVYDKCALYFIIVVLLSLALTLGRLMQIFAIYTSALLVSGLLLARMIFQIKYITPGNWNVTCGVGNSSYISNNADWFGFSKTTDVPRLVKWNIAYILIVTLWSVIVIRQYYYRVSRGRPTQRAFFMFPKINRSQADNDLKSCLKYLANYGFYKFGFEISMMATVALIGIRMDMYAVLYSVWLCILFSMKRSVLANIWIFYLIFIAVLLPFQYFMAVGLPPTLCQDFPWDKSNILRKLQDWAFLMDKYNPPPAKKLICDFILLLLVSRQWVVFRIERRYINGNYAGGSNKSIIHHAEEKDFQNPVPDFITYVRSYLDIFKKCILLSFLWITLAIVFLAGTNRTNIFSIGYLIGAFIFLWHGSDFYLRPIPNILSQWQRLLGYNVAVIFFKTSFQILGCILIQEIPTNYCWLVQLLGIGCVRKFGDLDLIKENDESSTQICKVPKEFIGIAWDGICFGLLIMQRRIFNSYNFFHMVDETKATTILASRGAELIEQRRLKVMKDQDETERQILEKIKHKMDKIKANQQKMQSAGYKVSQVGRECPPLARSSSISTCTSATSQSTPAGYHTPIDEEEPIPTTPRSSLVQPQAPPSPYSAVMTVSLEGYLEPQRMSFSSPPNSELNPRPTSPDDSFPVFSPPPYDEAPPYAEAVSEPPTIIQRRQSSIGPPWMQGTFVTPRQSIISYSSRSPLSHHEYTFFRPNYRRKPPVTHKDAIRSGDYYMFEDLEDDDEIDLLPQASEIEKLSISELLSTAMKTDISSAVRRHSQLELKRQYSMPLARKKSARSQLSAAFSAPPTIEEHEPTSVKIQELPKDPQPGTSKDEDISELTEPRDTIGRKIINCLLFIWAFIESVMISMSNFLNAYSRDYRYVLKVLAEEKKILKEKTNYKFGLRLGSSQVWQPAGSYQTLIRQSHEGSPLFSISSAGIFSPSDSYRVALVAQRVPSIQNSGSDEKPVNSGESDSKALAASLPYSSDQERRKASVLTVPEIRILAPSLERGLDSPCSSSRSSALSVHQTEEHHVEELSSQDQPTIVKLLLAIWYIIMSRSEVLCYFAIFLTQIKTATFMSLPLPLMVFFWGSLTIPRPTKTFWVTIIAYTEVIVLIKCVFQFDIMPGNSNHNNIHELNPFYPPKIIGTYRQKNYALWDLLLLLIVFFHRVLLKSMGIWSSTPVAAVMIHKGSFKFKDGQLIPVSSSSPKDDTEQNTSQSTSKKSQSTFDDNVLSIDSSEAQVTSHLPQALQLAAIKYGEAVRKFMNQLLDPTSRVAADAYSFMFLCDFFNFFVILIGYSSFGSLQDGGVSSYLQDNRVPPLFLFMLILQFMLIVIDRGIYLRKNILAKIIFQFTQIVLLHVWLFILFPLITGSLFNTVLPPQMYYMVKCFYLLLSAYQIRCGYPTRILGNFLCKGYGIVNMCLFKGFMLVPFLFELRTCMDWMWTDTSMTVFDWIKMEDIFAHVYQLKCSRNVDEEFPQARGEKKNPLVKYAMGSAILAVIIGIIWFPLVFFSLGNAVGESNIPYDVTLELRIGPYEPVYKMSAQSNSIFALTEGDLNKFKLYYNEHKAATTFLSNYEGADIAAVKLSFDSANIWSISPPDRKRMVAEIKSKNDLKVRLEYKVSHKTSNPEDSGVIPDNVEIAIPPTTNENATDVRTYLLEMLEGHNVESVTLKYILPKFLKVTNRGTAAPVDLLMLDIPAEEARKFRNVTLKLEGNGGTNVTQNVTMKLEGSGGTNQEWWTMHEVCDDPNFKKFLKKLPYQDCKNSLILYTFNDKIFPPTLSFLTGAGIIGLYTTLVFVASRVLRGLFADQCAKIMFEDLPNVNRVLQLCLDIYLVREAREFALEEDLFAKLVFLFRSPETLIKWSRPKEELGDDDDPEAEGQ